jgi:hypothetical protein
MTGYAGSYMLLASIELDVNKNITAARVWLEKSARTGNMEAIKMLSNISRKKDPTLATTGAKKTEL